MIKVKLLTGTAKMPKKANEFAAGFDVYADESFTITGSDPVSVSTGVSMAIPHGYYGHIQPRSGLAFKVGVDTMAGTIDSDYRGEIKILLVSHLEHAHLEFGVGERIAQIVIHKLPDLKMIEVDSLGDTERGKNGFGSSGMK